MLPNARAWLDANTSTHADEDTKDTNTGTDACFLMTVMTTVGDKVVVHSLGGSPTHGTQFRQ